MSEELLMFPEFARSAKALFNKEISDKTEQEKYITAVKDGRYSFSSAPVTDCYSLSLDNLAAARKSGRTISLLEIRCDYLQQLGTMRENAFADSVQLQLGLTSANTTAIRITAVQLQRSVSEELSTLLSSESRLKMLFGDKLLSEHGLLNTVSIKLQNPLATLLLTMQQISRMGFVIKADSNPILLFTPIVKSGFNRNGKLLPIGEATPEEQLSIVMGTLTTKQNIRYEINRYYDVGELRITERQRSKLLEASRGENISYEQICSFVSTLQNEAGVPLKVETATMQGVTLQSFYSAKTNEILINGRLNSSQMLQELISRLSDAIVTMTSASAEAVQTFEKQLLSVQLSAKWNIPFKKAAFAELGNAFNAASQNGSFSLEAVTARINAATQYVSAGVMSMVQNDIEQPKEQGNEQAMTTQQPIAGEPLGNFLQGI